MIWFRPGSHVHRLVTILALTGDYPMGAVHLMGNERVCKALVHRLTTVQSFRNSMTGEEWTCRLLTVTGKGATKSIRFYKAGLPILRWIGAERYYLSAFWNHSFPGDAHHRDRLHRMAEVIAMMITAGMEIRPWKLPVLQNQQILQIVPDEPVCYLARDLKRVGQTEMNKTMYSRLIGALFSGPNCYGLYNTRDAAMKWSGLGEFKVLQNLIEIARLNAGISSFDSALLFARSDRTALETLFTADRSRRHEFRFDQIYRHVHVIPMNDYGSRLLQLFTIPDWNQKLLELLFDPTQRSFNQGSFEYDAFVEGVYILSHLDGDIARLIRFRNGIERHQISWEILCWPEQIDFLRYYLGRDIRLKTMDFQMIEEALELKRRDLFETL